MRRIGALPPFLAFVAVLLLGDPWGASGAPWVSPLLGSATTSVHLDVTPSDQLFYKQWALPMMQVPYAWEITKGSPSVVVAVVDSGVDATHPDLSAHMLPIGCNIVADGTCPADGRGTLPTDEEGHGTGTAGIIGAVDDNQVGMAGIAWNVSILPVRVTTGLQFHEAELVVGLRWAADHGANVINVSASEPCGTIESSELRDVLTYAWNRGALIVAAAGNDSGCPQGAYPAADAHVLSVASTGVNDILASTSNRGSWVSVAAPGEGILTAYPRNQYQVESGTSAAAPQVSGLAALLFSVPGATNASVRSWITSTCDVPDNWNPANGCGRVNAYRAVSLAKRGMDPHTSSTVPVTRHLVAGLNNVVYFGATRSIDTALSSLDGNYTAVYAWDPQRLTWQTFLPGQSAASDLQLLQERSAYWIYVRTDADLTMRPSANAPPPQLTLPAGWNNLPLPAGPLPATLQAFSAPVKAVYAWNAASSSWSGYFPDASAASDLAALQADAAYWLYAPAPVVVTYHR